MEKRPGKRTSVKRNPPYTDKNKASKNNTYYNLSGIALIILLGTIIYSNSFDCSFHLDDSHTIVQNLKIRDLSDVSAWWNYSANRPVAFSTFALNYHFNQLDVRYWHLVNLVIHLVNAVLVWWLTLLIFSSPVMKDSQLAKHRKIAAFFAAVLFVSHPLATQSVVYIVQRMASLAAMFYLLSLALYVQARLTEKRKISRVILFSGSLVSAVLAMLTKENAFTLPFAILLFEFFFLQPKKLSINFRDYRVILLIVAFVSVILIIPLKYSFSILKPLGPSAGLTHSLNPVNYLLTEFAVIVKYIQLLFVPLHQVLDYNFPVSNHFFDLRTWLSFVFLLSLILLGAFLFKRNRIISFGIFWFFLTLSIESSIIPINDVIFEHRTYLPSFGFFIVVIAALYTLLKEKNAYIATGILTVITLTNSFLAHERNKIWKDEFTLWNDNVEKAPHLARPLTNRGVAYGAALQWEKAINDYTRAIEINPDYSNAFYNRGVAYGTLEQWDKAIADYSRVIELDSNFVRAFYNRGIAFGGLMKWDRAIADYSKAIQIDPDSKVHYSRGMAYGGLQQWDKAIDDYNRAIEINPAFKEAYSNRGIAYGNLQEWDKAISDYSRAIEIDLNYPEAYSRRADAYSIHQQWDKAIADYTRLIEMDRNSAKAYYNRGVAFANLRQWNNTINDCSKAIELDPKYAKAYYNRGFAHESLGLWDKAIIDYSSTLSIDPGHILARSHRELAITHLGKTRK